MKRVKTFLYALVATMMLFASCGKDEPETPNDNNGNGGDPTPAATYHVEFTYNDVTYFGIEEETEALLGDDFLRVRLLFESTDQNHDGGIEVRIRDLNTLNHTIDLSKHDPKADFFFHILLNTIEAGCWFDLGHNNTPESLDAGSYDGPGNPSCFSSGTAKFFIENDVLNIDCEAIYSFTNKKMTLKGTIPYTVQVPDENNVAIVDGVKYYLDSYVEVNDDGQVYFSCRNEDKQVFYYGLVPSDSFNKTIDLSNAQALEEYNVRLESPGLMFQQRNIDDQFSCILNGSYVEGPLFTSGTHTATIQGDDYILNLNGTMTDGTTVTVKLKVLIP